MLYNLPHFSNKRDNKLWVFGAWMGKKYEDNSRALFEYVNEQHRDTIRAVWLANTDSIVTDVRNRGYEAYRVDSVKGVEIAKRAGVAIYTNSLMDFGQFPKIYGAYIVSLWHGVGFKKIYNDKYSGWQLVAKKMTDKIFSWTHRDLTIVTSKYVAKQFSGIFGLKENAAIRICGQPRNDLFKENILRENVLRKNTIDYTKKIIIYMPTYRGENLGENAMTRIVEDLYKSDYLDKILTENNSVLVAKLHPNTPHINLERRNNFVILDNDEVESNQELLGISDMLITDYSSCCVDFALLNRPIIFYQPDEADFFMKSEPIYDELLSIIHIARCTTPEELANSIMNPSLDAVVKINNVFEDESIKGTCYSENVYKSVINELREN